MTESDKVKQPFNLSVNKRSDMQLTNNTAVAGKIEARHTGWRLVLARMQDAVPITVRKNLEGFTTWHRRLSFLMLQ